MATSNNCIYKMVAFYCDIYQEYKTSQYVHIKYVTIPYHCNTIIKGIAYLAQIQYLFKFDHGYTQSMVTSYPVLVLPSIELHITEITFSTRFILSIGISCAQPQSTMVLATIVPGYTLP